MCLPMPPSWPEAPKFMLLTTALFEALYQVLENIQIRINCSFLHQGFYDDEQITIPALHINTG